MSTSKDLASEAPGGAREIRFLNIIAIVAVIDFLLLIPLIWASRWVAHHEEIVSLLGPLHGILFVVLIGLCAYGATEKWWGWWFPILTVVTLGPPGSLIGDFVIRRQLKEKVATADGKPASDKGKAAS